MAGTTTALRSAAASKQSVNRKTASGTTVPKGGAKLFGVKVPVNDFELRYNVSETNGRSAKGKSTREGNSIQAKKSAYRAFQYHRDFMSLIKTWDRGSKGVREQILRDFIESNQGKSAAELDNELGGGASLFLTRVSAWIRLNYLTGNDLSIQIHAIRVFVASSGGMNYLNEFLEVGGLFTLLELLTLQSTKESEKSEAMRLIHDIVSFGNRYRDFCCECYGVRAIAEYLSKCKSDSGADYGRATLLFLGAGSSRYLPQVYKAFISVITSPTIPTKALQLSCQGLRALLPNINPIHPSIVDAALGLLRNTFYEVQHEGCEIIKELIHRPNLQDTILAQLISRLKTVVDPGHEKETTSNSGNRGTGANAEKWEANNNLLKNDNLLASYTQQACSARLLGALAVLSVDFAERMIELQCISGLLSAISNINFPESQKSAADTLLHLIEIFPRVADAIKEEVGDEFYDQLKESPDTFFKHLTKDQIRYLNRNSLKVRTGVRGDGFGGAGSAENSDASLDNVHDQSSYSVDQSKDEVKNDDEEKGDAAEEGEGKKDVFKSGSEDSSKSRGVYVPFQIPSTRATVLGKNYAEESEEAEVIEMNRINNNRNDKKSNKKNEYSISNTDLREEVPHLAMLRDEKATFSKSKVEGHLRDLEKPTANSESNGDPGAQGKKNQASNGAKNEKSSSSEEKKSHHHKHGDKKERHLNEVKEVDVEAFSAVTIEPKSKAGAESEETSEESDPIE